MASFVYAMMSITNVASMHCAERPEISPCTCGAISAPKNVELMCEKVDSFHKIVDALSNRFEEMRVDLKITHSQLDDLEMRSFKDMNLTLVKLRMSLNNLTSLPELPFRGLSALELLMISENELDEIPKHTLNHMPNLITFDMGRCRLRSVLHEDFRATQKINYLFLASNNITRLEKGAFPPKLKMLHLGHNQIETLNGTLRDLNDLHSLFINMNKISSLDNELPEPNLLTMMYAPNNRLERLPESMRRMIHLESVHIQCNQLRCLDSIFRNAVNMSYINAIDNKIEYLARDEFPIALQDLQLSFNQVKLLNNSLLTLKYLRVANFSFNKIEEFSLNEIHGLEKLVQLDLSYNRITKLLVNHNENEIDRKYYLQEFNLNNNKLTSLDGALMGVSSLKTLNLAFNQLERILPEDFIGLVKLEILHLSNNQLLTLSEMGTTYLPNLKILNAAYNNLTMLGKDFHGLPGLCQANLTNNQISTMSTHLISKTRCMNHNVPGTLELYLGDNPIMCDDILHELCSYMLSHGARIRGRSPCFENDQEVCTVLPMLFPTILLSENLPILRMIVPNPIGLKKPIDVMQPIIATLSQPTKPFIMTIPITTSTTSTTTTTSTTPAPVPEPEILKDTDAINIQLPVQPVDPDEKTFEIVDVAVDSNYTSTSTTTMVTPLNPIPIDDAIVAVDITTNLSVIAESAADAPTNDSFVAEELTTTTTTMKPGTVEIPTLVFDIDEPQPAGVANGEGVDGEAGIAVASALDTGLAAANGVTIATVPAPPIIPQVSAQYATVEYIPNLTNYNSGPAPGAQTAAIAHQQSDALDEDSKSNLVHEEFSSVVLTGQLQNAPSHTLLLPDEPPENP